MREWKESVAAKHGFYVALCDVEKVLCLACRLTKTAQRLMVAEKPWPMCTHCFSRFSESPAGGRYETAMRELRLVHTAYHGFGGGKHPEQMGEVVARWKALAGVAFTDWLRLEQVDCNAPRR